VHARLRGAEDRRLERERAALAACAGRLRALGPGATLERGYAIAVADDGSILREATDAAPGDAVEVRLASGRLTTRVEEVTP
jgi:exodeoxyribonuclease VII large subunit